jgi:hypothetical protein|tara:strand:+ start:771 stop:881 length:111 start_codon:yes stop_codon:yes gene_type:complete
MVETLFIVSLKMFVALGVTSNTVDYVTTFFVEAPVI